MYSNLHTLFNIWGARELVASRTDEPQRSLHPVSSNGRHLSCLSVRPKFLIASLDNRHTEAEAISLRIPRGLFVTASSNCVTVLRTLLPWGWPHNRGSINCIRRWFGVLFRTFTKNFRHCQNHNFDYLLRSLGPSGWEFVRGIVLLTIMMVNLRFQKVGV